MLSESVLTEMLIVYFQFFLTLKHLRKKMQLLGFYNNIKRARNLSESRIFKKKSEIPLFMVSKSALTDMWIDVFEILLRSEISKKKYNFLENY